MSKHLRNLVEARAKDRCEYCRRYMEMLGDIFFEVEHIVPSSRGGSTTPENLALACHLSSLQLTQRRSNRGY